MKKNPILFYLLGIFIVLNLADVITTLYILPGESNPLFHAFGGIWPVFLGKILIIVFLVRLYNKNMYPSNVSYYTIITALTFSILALLFAQYSNITAIMNPAILAQAAAMPAKEKVQAYFVTMGFIYLAPVFLSILSFFFYDKSRKNVTVDKKFFEEQPWWKQL